jgi:uncharacterized membrane protein YhaH (DUF805 family)
VVVPSSDDEIIATMSAMMTTLDLLMRRLRDIERRLTLLTVAVLVTFAAVAAYLIGQAAR